MIDFRGYGKSTGTPAHLNIALDGQFVFNYLLHREDVKHIKISIYGASIGTQEAAHLTKNNQNKIAALIMDGTMKSTTDIAVNHSLSSQENLIRQNLIYPYSAKENIKSIKNLPKLLCLASMAFFFPNKKEIFS
jgi:pimeloyl-ACP methyl ester carboxylesterase